MSGALVPFAILYVFGLINLTRILLPRISPWVVLLAIVAICCGSEIAVKHSVFESEHNWFHLGTDQDRI